MLGLPRCGLVVLDQDEVPPRHHIPHFIIDDVKGRKPGGCFYCDIQLPLLELRCRILVEKSEPLIFVKGCGLFSF